MIDIADECPVDTAKVEAGRCGCGFSEMPSCGDAPRCRGNIDIGITLDGSGSIGPADFEATKEQVRVPLQLLQVYWCVHAKA